MSHLVSLESARSAGLIKAKTACVAALLAALILFGAVGGSYAAESDKSLTGVVNLNTASLEELQQLPGVGQVRATAILDTRKQKGGFKSVDELVDVKGVGPALLDRLRPHISVKGKTTLSKL